jgi:hypothetical protein
VFERYNATLGKASLPTSVKTHRHLIPGLALDSRHIVVQGANGKNKIRQVAAGMQRDTNSDVGNPIGAGMGNPLSTRMKPTSV